MPKEKKHEEIEKKKAELPPQQTEAEAAKERLGEKDKQIEEMKNRYLRALADLDNFKKRAALEKDDILMFSNEMLIKDLLPTVDTFGKALEAMQKTKTHDDIVKGIALIKKQLEDTLSKFGVKQVESVGKPYDPNIHEAILTKDSDSEDGMVLEEMQKGYTLHGKLLRPSMVIVSRKNK